MKKPVRFAVLKRDFVYENCGQQTMKKGTRIRLNDTNYFAQNGDLFILHFYAFNQGEVIPAEFFKGN